MITSAVLVAAIAITGQVQFWQRHCAAAAVCGLPTPVSARLPVAGQVPPSAGPGQLGYFKTILSSPGEAAHTTMTLEVFWKGEDLQGEPYIAAQVSVHQVDDDHTVPLAQCNGFHDVPEAGAFFPVGVCAGFTANADGTYEQRGVTFYRPAP